MLVEITNAPRGYAWGSMTAIAEFRGVEPSGGPEAELWFGTHPGSPARLVGRPGTLSDVTRAPLPFLLKVLAADAPLSLQVHPDAEQAAQGFAREEAAGIALDDPARNYRDASAKPEMLYALGPFRALVGFRPAAASREMLRDLRDPRISPLIERLVDAAALPAVVAWLLEGDAAAAETVSALAEAAALPEPIRATVRALASAHPGDPGVAVGALMNTVVLDAGDAIYVPAGVVHAYLTGLGVEHMVASDNVLRAGLTSKHIDVAELFSIADFTPSPPTRLAAEHTAPGLRVFRTPDDLLEFVVARPADAVSELRISTPAPAIALVIESEVLLDSGAGPERWTRGSAGYLPGGSDLSIGGSGVVAVASAAEAGRGAP
jgi:mannose-6-phosphate isomerase